MQGAAHPLDQGDTLRPRRLASYAGAPVRWVADVFARGWAAQRLLAGGVGVGLIACLLAILFHLHRAAPFVPYHDTLEYVRRADRILAGDWWVDADRLPGYPLLLVGVFLFTGKNNLVAADVVQNILFVLSALEVYALAYRVWHDARFAMLIGVLFASNFYFLSYVKPILSDGLALVLTLALALATLSCLERPRIRAYWLTAALLFALIFTRAEWYLFPIPLFALLLVTARRTGHLRTLLPHAVLAVALIYASIFLYARLNFAVNGVAGLTEIQDLNLYGKVLQYQMQDEAPLRFVTIQRISDGYVKSQEYDPWFIYRHEPELAANHFALMGAYSRAIIVHHPVQFLNYSARVLLRSLYEHWAFATLIPGQNGAGALYMIEQFSSIVYALFMLFPLCVAGWIVVWWRSRGREDLRRVEAMIALSLFAVYDLALTTLGSYGEYPRLHLSFDPLMLIVVVGTLILAAERFIRSERPSK